MGAGAEFYTLVGTTRVTRSSATGDLMFSQATITVVMKQPEVEHKVRVKDFENWLESAGRNPAEMSLKSRLRLLLGISAVAEARTGKR